jgi:hypothetical protein
MKVRMRLSGETIVGRYMDKDDPDAGGVEDPERYAFFINRPEHPPTNLVYSTDLGWPKSRISIITTYSEHSQDGTFEQPRHHYCPPPDASSWAIMHSHAPLENIRQVRMFYYQDRSVQSCKGLLVEYDDGGKRALGQCRLHVDPSDTFERPTRIAFLHVADTYPRRLEVLFDELPSADHPQLNEWFYYEMTGTLDFWFSTNHERMAVREGKAIPQMDLWDEVSREEPREDS